MYLLFSDDANDPTWNDIGFGDRYCPIPNEQTWASLITKAGGDWTDAQFSLHRAAIDPRGTQFPVGDDFLAGRTQAACPTSFVRGLPQDGDDVPLQPGEVVRTKAGAISLVTSQRQLRHVENMDVYNGCGIDGSKVREIDDATAAYLTKGAALTAAADCKALRLKPSTEFVRTKAGTVYVLHSAMSRRQIDNMGALNGCGIDMNLVREVTDAVANAVPAGGVLTTADQCKEVRRQPLVDANRGTLPQAVTTSSGALYVVDKGDNSLRWVLRADVWDRCTAGEPVIPTVVDGWAVGLMRRGAPLTDDGDCRRAIWSGRGG